MSASQRIDSNGQSGEPHDGNVGQSRSETVAGSQRDHTSSTSNQQHILSSVDEQHNNPTGHSALAMESEQSSTERGAEPVQGLELGAHQEDDDDFHYDAYVVRYANDDPDDDPYEDPVQDDDFDPEAEYHSDEELIRPRMSTAAYRNREMIRNGIDPLAIRPEDLDRSSSSPSTNTHRESDSETAEVVSHRVVHYPDGNDSASLSSPDMERLPIRGDPRPNYFDNYRPRNYPTRNYPTSAADIDEPSTSQSDEGDDTDTVMYAPDPRPPWRGEDPFFGTNPLPPMQQVHLRPQAESPSGDSSSNYDNDNSADERAGERSGDRYDDHDNDRSSTHEVRSSRANDSSRNNEMRGQDYDEPCDTEAEFDAAMAEFERSQIVEERSRSRQSITPSRRSSARMESTEYQPPEIVLPRWQLDAEVTICPICGTQFSFFVRKHHCRKCGRVVCGACSPHRITIPYQYIVQPPLTQGHSTGISEDNDGGSQNLRGGGERVRLCNPCVPDPNNQPPTPNALQQYHSPGGFSSQSAGSRHARGVSSSHIPVILRDPRGGNVRFSRSRSSTVAHQPYTDYGQAVSSRSSSGRLNSGGQSSVTGFRHPYQNVPPGSTSNTATQGTNYRATYYNTASYGSLNSPRSANPRANTSNTNISRAYYTPTAVTPVVNPQPHYQSLLDVGEPTLSSQSPVGNERPLPAIPVINEEDECPICHRELPSTSLPNFEILRTVHVTRCIDARLARNSRPAPYSSRSQPQGHSVTSDASGFSPSPISAPGPRHHHRGGSPSRTPLPNLPESHTDSSPSAHPLAADTHQSTAYTTAATAGRTATTATTSDEIEIEPAPFAAHRQTRMFPYRATEKDCVDDAECTICLEEFEVNDKMARLECFCRFHRQCIREWFEGHPGRCPVHQHDGYGY